MQILILKILKASKIDSLIAHEQKKTEILTYNRTNSYFLRDLDICNASYGGRKHRIIICVSIT